MDESSEKENSVSIVSSPAVHNSSILGQPLTSKRSTNSLNSVGGLISPTKSDSGSVSPKRKMDSSFMGLQKDYKNLERSYTDLLFKNKDLLSENEQYESELEAKCKLINDQSSRILNYEKLVRSVQADFHNSRNHFEREIAFYKEQIITLQNTINRLSKDAEEYKSSTGSILDSQTRYENLMKDFKVLQSNFEIEQKSKLVFVDQIEFLTRQNEEIMAQLKSAESNNSGDQRELLSVSEGMYHGSDKNSIIHNISIDSDDQFSEEENIDELQGTQMLSYLADELKNNHSSPIKREKDESLEVVTDFQFPSNPSAPVTNSMSSNVPKLDNNSEMHMPPSPDPISRDLKRQSLPAQLKGSTFYDEDEFILSPFKLSNTASYFDGDTSVGTSKKRYSGFKANHSRYNSYDILPIKVEFEESEPNMRSTSAPEKEHLTKIESVDEVPDSAPLRRSVRNSTFSILNGDNYVNSKRNSLNTSSSSKRSSLFMEGPMTNDMTRQEIMKLKFELQSLKLHNEKLLSYIGFELQKQKKNIHKLSSRQSLNDSRKRMEYSDAKLIEKSRDVLIHKKRVLRSVSINSIMSKHYENSSMGIITKGLVGKGFIPFNGNIFDFQLSGLDQSDNEDDYGFMNHNDNFSRRIFSNTLQSYLNFDDVDDTIPSAQDNYAQIKKYKSQILVSKEKDPSSDESFDDFDDTDMGSPSKNIPIDVTLHSGMFNHIKALLFGPANFKGKHKKSEEKLVDDTLKYKFFTLAVGLMIISLKLSHRNEQLQITH